MPERFNRSWSLMKQCWSVLRSDQQLLIFPLFSSIACLLAMAAFLVPPALAIDWSQFADSETAERLRDSGGAKVLLMLVSFCWYFVTFLIVTFFNSALVACTINRFNGEDASIGAGLRVASSRLPQIIGWALIAATVGVILQSLRERAGFLGRLIVGFFGLAWTIATFFVVPILVVEGIGPIDAAKRSVAMIRKAWGEAAITNIGFSAVSMLAVLLVIAVAAGGIAMAVSINSLALAGVVIGIALLLLVAIGLVMSTLRVILLAALYRYASTGLVPAEFDGALLRRAFEPKR